MRKLALSFLVVALAAATVAAQNAPTLRIVTEDPTLPSEMFYGNTRVRPLRLRPGTNQPITIDDSDFFVQQHYLDFLNRFPEPGGFEYWMGRLNTCAATPGCDLAAERIRVSAGFYFSPEFYRKGYLVYRFYRASLGRIPRYSEMIPDMRLMAQNDEQEEAKRVEFAQGWVNRPEFAARYANLSNADFVAKLAETAGVALDQAALISQLNNGATRAQVVRTVVENQQVGDKYFQEAFVAMLYFGYLRRDYDEDGFQYWLTRLRNNPEDLNAIVGGFIYSREYRDERF